MSDGEIWPVLLFGGLPLILPNLWIDELSLSSRPNTLEAYLRDIAILYKWAERRRLSLNQRFSGLRGFHPSELREIAYELCHSSAGEALKAATCERRAKSMSAFMDFSFDYFIELEKISLLEQAQAEKNKKKQIRRLTKQIEFSSRRSQPSLHATDLTQEEVELINSVLHPNSEQNPFRDYGLRVRNYCIFHVILATLARKGELVLIEITDLDLGELPTICIKEPEHQNRLRRKDGANLKTRGRLVPITEELAQLLRHYVYELREDYLVQGRPSTALFLSSLDGRRLSSHTINQILDLLKTVPKIQSIGKRIHPHGLRSTGANIYRRRAALDGRLSSQEIQELICYMGGWAPGSPVAQLYTQTATAERLRLLLSGNRSTLI